MPESDITYPRLGSIMKGADGIPKNGVLAATLAFALLVTSFSGRVEPVPPAYADNSSDISPSGLFLNAGAIQTPILTGVNIRNALYRSGVERDLAEIANIGSLVRVFVGNNKISDDAAADRLSSFLDLAQRYNISVIPSLLDMYNSGHNPQGMDSYYTDRFGPMYTLNHNFFAGGYQDRYMQFVSTVVSKNKGHSNIYAWGIGNELHDQGDPLGFRDFNRVVSSSISNIDGVHPIAAGVISTQNVGFDSPDKFYGPLPNVGIVTLHVGNADNSLARDVTWAAANGRKAILEEIGISGQGRPQVLEGQLEFWKQKGISAALQWGFIPPDAGDTGDGDKLSGLDPVYHDDYPEMRSVWRRFGLRIT